MSGHWEFNQEEEWRRAQEWYAAFPKGTAASLAEYLYGWPTCQDDRLQRRAAGLLNRLHGS